jgi:hypothetical protein
MAYTTIKKPSDYFNTNLHNGTGSDRNITGIGFQPDFTIVKRRDNTGVWYNTDIVRGAGKQMYLNETGGMGGSASTAEITGFNSDGFNLGTDSGVNASGGTYVSYNFLGNNTTGSSNTDGTITSTVSANTTAGFSISKYTATGSNATVGHGLGAAPAMVILKNLDSARSWTVGHNGLTNWNYHLYLNATNAENSDSTMFQGTAPSSTVFSVGTASETNESGNDFIAYCFAEKQGYSKFGKYTGNGSTDGSFVYTGFKPAFVMVKRTDTTKNWYLQDNSRNGYNASNPYLSPNINVAETGGTEVDLLSNGFKLRAGGTGHNESGGTYIFMAFAEQPLVGDNPATAR